MRARTGAPDQMKMLGPRCASIARLLCPVLISFFCIGLFLLLSFAIIEGYSVSRMMMPERDRAVYGMLSD